MYIRFNEVKNGVSANLELSSCDRSYPCPSGNMQEQGVNCVHSEEVLSHKNVRRSTNVTNLPFSPNIFVKLDLRYYKLTTNCSIFTQDVTYTNFLRSI